LQICGAAEEKARHPKSVFIKDLLIVTYLNIYKLGLRGFYTVLYSVQETWGD